MSGSEEDVSVANEMIDLGDAPIGNIGEDRLGRRSFAEALATEILAAPASRGYIMGLTGPWGSGKTSILNMTIEALGNQAIVVQFNPWMFSGTEALVGSFFEEIGKELNKRDSTFKAVAEKFARYGRLFLPLASLAGAGSAVTAAVDAVEGLISGPSVLEQREELRSMLEKLERRLVVVIDDVDRLRPQEVLDIVRLVRLVGDFPNTLYLLAFDRGRVEEYLGEGKPDRGRDYLEKIVQVTHDVPAARRSDVTRIFVDDLQRLVDVVPTGPLDTGDWQNIFSFVIEPLLVTPRSVRRLLASLSMTMRQVGEEVAMADLIGVEAIRVLRPTMFEAVVSVADHLSIEPKMASGAGSQHWLDPLETPVAPLFQVDPALARVICQWLFPGARHYIENTQYGPEWEVIWKNKRKVASLSVFRFYLERQLPDGVAPARVVERALDCLNNGESLRDLLQGLSSVEILDLVERLNANFEEIAVNLNEMENDPARVALPVLLDLLPRLPEDTGLLSFSGSMVLMRAAVRLLGRLSTEELRTEVIQEVFRDTRSRSARLILLFVVGHRQDIGIGLVSGEAVTALENELRNDLIGLLASDFIKETRPVRLADLMAETEAGMAALHRLAEDKRVMLSLLELPFRTLVDQYLANYEDADFVAA